MAKKQTERTFKTLWRAFRKDKRMWLTVSEDGAFFGFHNGRDSYIIPLESKDIYELKAIFDLLQTKQEQALVELTAHFDGIRGDES